MNSFVGHLSPNIKDDDARLQSSFCWHINGFDSMDAVKKRVAELKAVNPNLLIGCHRSASTFLPVSLDFPGHPKHVAPDADGVNESWLLRNSDGTICTWPKNPDRPYADISKDKVRARIILEAVKMARELGMGAISWDNVYYEYGLGMLSPVQVTYKFLEFLIFCRAACDAYGLKMIINVCPAAQNIPAIVDTYADYVDGLMFEEPFYKTVTADPKLWQKERQAYRFVLEKGKCLYLWVNDLFMPIQALDDLMREFPNQIFLAKFTGWDNDKWFYYGE